MRPVDDSMSRRPAATWAQPLRRSSRTCAPNTTFRFLRNRERGYHALRIEVRPAQKLEIHARQGYYAMAE
jgi:hypothetical protein